MDDIVPTVAVLIIKDNKVLLVKHKEGAKHLTDIYGLPGGRIDKNEIEKDTAIRELKEETGLITSKENLIDFPNNSYHATIERKGGNFINCSWKVFLCIDYNGDIKESYETTPQWIEISMIVSLNILTNTVNAVTAGLEYLENSK